MSSAIILTMVQSLLTVAANEDGIDIVREYSYLSIQA